MSKVRRAIISVSDKAGIVEFAKGLSQLGVEILSTGGTARALSAGGVALTKVSDHTGAPEILDGRVKTLHPKIHGGLLGRPTEDHIAQMEANDIAPIDLIVVNLYPFEQTIAQEGTTFAEAIEQIDIGGPSMLRSAAKNHERVGVVIDPSDYEKVLGELRENDGALSQQTRFELARKAFAATAAYDAAISAYLTSFDRADETTERAPFPGVLSLQWERALTLRYGENLHQIAAYYADKRSPLATSGDRPSLARAEVLQGKALSYNNLLDLDGALGCCLEFTAPTAVVVKHTNPCGVASSDDGVAVAYKLARQTDPTSSFGGIVAVNRQVDEALATQLVETFLECVIAPSYSDEARQILKKKKNLRLVATGEMKVSPTDKGWAMRSVAGGILLQSADYGVAAAADARVVTKRQPTADELASLDFAWRVAKHVKSNAILFAKGRRTMAVGAGQMSRIDSVQLCKLKAQMPLEGSCVASDAFFPFRDGVDALVEAGATAVIQPGGSIRDEEVIAAADEHGIAMLFTGFRHFRH